MKTILLIEDEIESAETMVSYLVEAGYNMIDVPTGKEALDILKNQKPDLIICDYYLPNMDGFEFIKTVRDTKDRNIPFIMITGFKSLNLEDKAREYGAIDFLQKPINHQELVEKVAKFLA